MRKLIVIVLAGLLIVSFGLSAQTVPFEEQVVTLMGRLLKKVPKSDGEIRVLINPPRYVPWGTTEEPDMLIGGGFKRYFQTSCESAVDPPFGLIPRDELKDILAEVKLAQMSELSNPDEMFGSLKELVSQEVVMPLDAIIMLDYSVPEGSQTAIKTSLYLLDVKKVRKYVVTGTLRELTEGIVAKAQKKPANYQQIVQQKQNISNMLPGNVLKAGTFDLSVRVDRGAGGVYVEDEKMTIDVSTEEDCYIAVFNINVKGKTNILFPNPWEQNNFIRAGELRQIPAPESEDYDLVISEPFGIETIKVVASRTPFQVDSLIKGNEAAFPELSKGLSNGDAFPEFGSGGLAKSVVTMKALTRSVVAQARITYPEQKMRFAEAQCFFTTVPGSTKRLWMD